MINGSFWIMGRFNVREHHSLISVLGCIDLSETPTHTHTHSPLRLGSAECADMLAPASDPRSLNTEEMIYRQWGPRPAPVPDKRFLAWEKKKKKRENAGAFYREENDNSSRQQIYYKLIH